MTENLIKAAIEARNRKEAKPEESAIPLTEQTESKPVTTPEVAIEPAKKRGRPATGKRSDNDWIGRTYYVKRETDLDVEDELLKLRRKGVEVDKSELVDLLLGAWVKWHQGENIEIHISEITPRRKGEKSK